MNGESDGRENVYSEIMLSAISFVVFIYGSWIFCPRKDSFG